MSNPSLAGLHKVGRTTGDLRRRAAELHATGVPTPFRAELALWVSDCAQLEGWVHRRLAGDRVSRGREFFRTSLRDIVDVLQRGTAELGLVCDEEHDPKGLLPGTRERWAREAAARAEERRKAQVEAREAGRRALIERELREATSEAKHPAEAMRWRTALVVGGVMVVAALGVLVVASQEGARGWFLVLLSLAMGWLLLKLWAPATDAALASLGSWRSIKQREQWRLEQLEEAAAEAVLTGAESLSSYLANHRNPSILTCTGCGVGLRLPGGKKALVRCPKCGKRDYYDTRR